MIAVIGVLPVILAKYKTRLDLDIYFKVYATIYLNFLVSSLGLGHSEQLLF